MENSNPQELLILWTNDNIGTSINMVLMYAENAKLQGWWNNVTVLIWGATAKLVSDNPEIKNHIQALHKAQVKVVACRQCAENYNVVDELQKQNIEVFYTGTFLTDWIKENKKLLSV